MLRSLVGSEMCIRDRLDPNQALPVTIGDLITYNITVYNQGTLDAFNIEVVDYLPTGFILADNNWSSGTNPAEAYNTFAGPLAPGDSTVIPLTLQITADAIGGDTQNFAEISEADDDTDPTNDPPNDSDSEPDNDMNNDCLLYTSPSPRDS